MIHNSAPRAAMGIVRSKPTFILLFLLLALAGTGLVVANPAIITMERAEEADEAVATFPHWKHQDSYKCYTCHPSLFSMREKVAMTHENIDAKQYCGACHNGQVAFYPDDEDVDCEVCHVE